MKLTAQIVRAEFRVDLVILPLLPLADGPITKPIRVSSNSHNKVNSSQNQTTYTASCYMVVNRAYIFQIKKL